MREEKSYKIVIPVLKIFQFINQLTNPSQLLLILYANQKS